MGNELARLSQFIVDYFNLQEFRDLCFELSVNYDDLGEEKISVKARELLLYMGRKGRLLELLQALQRRRPVPFLQAGFSSDEAATEALLAALPHSEAERAIADLAIHEKNYRARVKEYFAGRAPYFIPLAGAFEMAKRAPRLANLAATSGPDGEQAGQPGEQVIEFANLPAVIDRQRRIALLGEPGSGKTTALKKLAFQYADQSEWMPIALDLSEFLPGDTVEAFVRESWGGSLDAGNWGAAELAANLDGLLEAGKLFLLFDALDEMPREKQFLRILDLRRFIDRWSSRGNAFLVTCRTMDYPKELSGLQRIVLKPLDDTQIRRFLRENLPEDWEQFWLQLTELSGRERKLLDLARNPFSLEMMREIFVDGGQLKQGRAEMIREYVGRLFEKAERRSPPGEWLKTEAQQKVLSILAHEMHKAFWIRKRDQEGSDPDSPVVTGIAKRLMPREVQIDPGWPALPTPPEEVLAQAQSAGIIKMPTDRSSVRFNHLLLREYYTAVYHADNANNGALATLIDSYLTDRYWREVFILTAGLLNRTGVKTYFALFRQSIDQFITGDEAIVALLKWVEKKAAEDRSQYESSINLSLMRSVYCSLALRRAAFLERYEYGSFAYGINDASYSAAALAKTIDADYASEIEEGDDFRFEFDRFFKEFKLNLANEQTARLMGYFYANTLFVESLRMSQLPNKARTEDTLLLPPNP